MDPSKKVLRPGLKRSATGSVVQDANGGRVVKRSGNLASGTGAYKSVSAKAYPNQPAKFSYLRKKNIQGLARRRKQVNQRPQAQQYVGKSFSV